nr:putative ribonuclease H-like domain-containing protein [Tanacetum cinerariifolium]
PKTSNLLSVKRIFKYLIAYPKLGLWYPRDSLFDLEAFSDSDYAGAHGDKKSTTGGCQFLERRLISWQCKNQTIVATSSCEAEYVAAASCCGQWFLFTSAGRVTFCWLFPIPAGDLVSAAFEVYLPDGVKGLVATIDDTAYTITEASIRSALQLDDLNAIDTMTNAEIFAGLRDIGVVLGTNLLGPDIPLLAHMLNQGEPAFVQAQQQEVSPPPPSHVVAPHPSPDPMPSPLRQSSPPSIPFGLAPSSRVVSSEPIPDIPSSSELSEPVLETITSPIRGDDTGGGSFHESLPRPPSATLTSSPIVRVAEEPLTLTSLLAMFPTCLQRIATLEAELMATKILRRDTVNEEEARQSQKLEALLDLANAALHEPSHSTTPSKPANPEQSLEHEISPTTLDAVLTLSQSKSRARAATIIYKRLKKHQSSSGLDFTDAAILASGLDSTGRVDSAGRVVSAGRVDSAGELDSAGRGDSAVGRDSAGRVVSAGGVNSADGLISAGVFVVAGPTVPAEHSSLIRDPSKGKAAAILEAERQKLLEQELKQSLDAEQVYLDSLLAQRVAEEHKRESMASAAQSTQRQAELDRVALNLTNKEWIGLLDQVRANPTLSAALLGADVSKDTFYSSAIYTIGWTWKDVRGLTDDQQIVYDKIRRAVDLAAAKDHHQHLKRSGETLESSKSKKLKSSHSTEQPAELQETTSVSAGATIAAGDPIPVVTYVSAAFSVPVGTPIAAGVSTTAGASGYASEAYVPIIELLDSPLKDISLPLDPETEEQDVPLRISSRKKSITKKRTLPNPSKSKYAALPFDEDDPEAKFKKYLRQVFDDDEPAEPVSLALVSDIRTWEIIPTEFGLDEIHVITRADGTVKRFSTMRELMYWAGRADLMVLYGMVSDKYKMKRATGIGLGLWSDLRTLITAREDRYASIIWDDQDQWEIRSWRLYALPAIHVLETEARDIIYMFVDKKYPLTPVTIQRMLNQIDRDPASNDLTTAIQLIQSLVNQLNPAA